MQLTYEQAIARTWLEVNENALLSNYEEAKSLCDSAALIAVLKADAYGFGAQHIAKVLWAHGVTHFSVACVPEAMEILRVLPKAWVLNMGATPPSYLSLAIAAGVRLTAGTEQEMRDIQAHAAALQKTANVHVKVDTGLHRLGFVSTKTLSPLCHFQNIHLEGLYSHLALRSREQSEEQFARFMRMAQELKNDGIQFDMLHLVDSIGLERYPKWQLDGARVGAFLYGNVPPDYAHFERRQAVAKFCTRITRVETIQAGEGIGYDDTPLEKETRVATLAVGYVDGYARSLSQVGAVEIRGQRARVLGLVCMDQMMVDVTDIHDAAPGDIAVLLGNGISLNEYAAWGHLNRNEATAMIGRRVPRVYVNNGVVTEILNRMDD